MLISVNKILFKMFLISLFFYVIGICTSFWLQIDLLTINFDPVAENTEYSFLTLCLNNLNVHISIALLGFFSLGIYAIYCIFLNGFLMGIYVYTIFVNYENPWSIIAKGLLPHFMEFLAIWLSGAIGLYGIQVFFRLIKNEKIFKHNELKFLIKYILIIIFFTVIAAYMEIYVSVSWITGGRVK